MINGCFLKDMTTNRPRQCVEHGNNPFLLALLLEPKVLYISVSCWLLAQESRDLSQAETKMTIVKS